jgi:hypothetical protein
MNSGIIVALVILVLATIGIVCLEMNSRRNARAAELREANKSDEQVS